MRYLADENMSAAVVAGLRAAGHDVAFISEDSPSLPDHFVLARAVRESRVLITYDKDYGKLVFVDRQPADSGVILFRLRDLSPEARIRFMVSNLDNEVDWRGHFATIRIGPTGFRSGTET